MKIAGTALVVLLVTMVQAGRRQVPEELSVFETGDEFELVDLTHPFNDKTQGYPGLKPFELFTTQRGYTDAGYWLQLDDYRGAIHVGTHMDAPCHIMRGQWTMEQIPIERFMAPAAMVDISSRASGDRNTNLEVDDLLQWEWRHNRTLDDTIVMVNSGWSKRWYNTRDFIGTDTGDLSRVSFPGVSPEAAEWIAENRRVYGLGIDTTSLDSGRAVHRKAHEALFRANIYGLENVANLHRIPEFGAYVLVFPMRIGCGACGSPTRIIAQVPKLGY